ncbi:hypothetical protein Scep_030239 [Stephania cephalantha]|uniref:HAT C-terminal dimerisation domain-containing protein n=1 Tax=Stephania cephalantha TaxID=152367 RepID=A0AAP0E6Z3_9MAGN
MLGTMSAGRSCQEKVSSRVEHHYHFDMFNSVIDYQLEELNYRFNDDALEILKLSCALQPNDQFKLFDVDQICILARKLYPADFSDQEMHHLICQLEHYEVDVLHHKCFKNLSSTFELLEILIRTNKSHHYNLVERLIRLILTLHVSTASTERAFSAMKRIKTDLRNRMEEEFLTDTMIIHIEREFAQNIDIDEVIDEFDSLKQRRAQLK